jgi:hypothetical protein
LRLVHGVLYPQDLLPGGGSLQRYVECRVILGLDSGSDGSHIRDIHSDR